MQHQQVPKQEGKTQSGVDPSHPEPSLQVHGRQPGPANSAAVALHCPGANVVRGATEPSTAPQGVA